MKSKALDTSTTEHRTGRSNLAAAFVSAEHAAPPSARASSKPSRPRLRQRGRAKSGEQAGPPASSRRASDAAIASAYFHSAASIFSDCSRSVDAVIESAKHALATIEAA